jgi:hypothetical protein
MPDSVSRSQGTHTAITAGLVRKVAKHAVTSPIESVNTVAASGSALTLPDVTTATMHDVTLTANCTFTFPAAGAGKSFSLRLVQDGTGSRTVTWPGTVKWAGGTAPTLSTAAGAVDTFAFVCFDGTRFEAFYAGKGHA